MIHFSKQDNSSIFISAFQNSDQKVFKFPESELNDILLAMSLLQKDFQQVTNLIIYFFLKQPKFS